MLSSHYTMGVSYIKGFSHSLPMKLTVASAPAAYRQAVLRRWAVPYRKPKENEVSAELSVDIHASLLLKRARFYWGVLGMYLPLGRSYSPPMR